MVESLSAAAVLLVVPSSRVSLLAGPAAENPATCPGAVAATTTTTRKPTNFMIMPWTFYDDDHNNPHHHVLVPCHKTEVLNGNLHRIWIGGAPNANRDSTATTTQRYDGWGSFLVENILYSSSAATSRSIDCAGVTRKVHDTIAARSLSVLTNVIPNHYLLDPPPKRWPQWDDDVW